MLLYEQKSEPKAGKHSFQVLLVLYPVLPPCLLSILTAPQANNTINMRFLGSPARPKGTHHQGNSLNIACRSWRICFGVLLVSIPHSPSLPGHMGNHSTSLSSPIITILLSSELESDTFSKTFQITPLLGFSTKPFRANLCFVLVSLNRLDVT